MKQKTQEFLRKMELRDPAAAAELRNRFSVAKDFWAEVDRMAESGTAPQLEGVQSEDYIKQVVSQLKGESHVYPVNDTLSTDGIVRTESDIARVVAELKGVYVESVIDKSQLSADGIIRTEADIMAVVNELKTASGY